MSVKEEISFEQSMGVEVAKIGTDRFTLAKLWELKDQGKAEPIHVEAFKELRSKVYARLQS